MSVRRGVKGKYFTEVVRKKPVRATIRTRHGIIRGTIHLHPEARTLDELNAVEDFLPITEATIDEGGETIETDFVAVSKAHILWVNPLDEGSADE